MNQENIQPTNENSSSPLGEVGKGLLLHLPSEYIEYSVRSDDIDNSVVEHFARSVGNFHIFESGLNLQCNLYPLGEVAEGITKRQVGVVNLVVCLLSVEVDIPEQPKTRL